MLDRESNENKNQTMVAVIVKQLMSALNLYRNFRVRVRVLEPHTDCWLDQPEPKILGPYWRRFSGSGLVAEPRWIWAWASEAQSRGTACASWPNITKCLSEILVIIFNTQLSLRYVFSTQTQFEFGSDQASNILSDFSFLVFLLFHDLLL